MDLFEAAAAGGGNSEGGWADDYVSVRIDAAACDPALAEDLQGLIAARWLSEVLRHDFEQASYGARINGPCGSFEGVVAEEMPNYWRNTGQTSAGAAVWQPDGRHPLGKWLGEVASRLLPLPPLDVLDAVLRRHGIEGSKEPLPVMKECEGGWALLIHKPKAKSFGVPGITRDDSLRKLWEGSPQSP